MSTEVETKMGPSRDGSVVLDIGGNIGALVLLTPPELCGEELELTPKADTTAKVHTEVRERLTETGNRYAAIYPQLAAGEYEIDRNRQQVSIIGSEITEVVLEGTDHEFSGADEGR